MPPQQIHLTVPSGTKVLTRDDGTVGVVVRSPESPADSYLIRFADGGERSAVRSNFKIYRQERSAFPQIVAPADCFRFVAYRCVVGSQAYGLAVDGSDVDRRGFYLPPADWHWSLGGVPEQIEPDREEVYWELGKFIRFALKASPNVLECLYSPIVEHASPVAAELLSLRDIFLSQYVHRTYSSYVLSQFKKLEQDLRNHGRFRWKHVMHLIRLLLSGVTVLKEGFVPLRVDRHRDRLLAIKRGEVAWEEVERWRLKLHGELDEALNATPLPPHPDYERANGFLIRARRFAASTEYGS